MKPPSAFPHLDVRSTGDGTVITLINCPLLDERHTRIVREELARFLEAAGGCRLFLNLGNVERLISASLTMLLTIHNDLRDAGGQLIVCNIRPTIDDVLQVTRLNQVLDIRSEPPPGFDQTGPGDSTPPEDRPDGSDGPPGAGERGE
jgi:anti-anti-sigma factor